MKNIALNILLLMLFIAYSAQAQQAVISAGGDFVSAEASVSWTLGELLVDTFQGDSGMVTHGIQQIGIMVTSFPTLPNEEQRFKVYPNPAYDILKVKTIDEDFQRYTLEMVDMSGALIMRTPMTNAITELPVIQLNAALYFIRIKENEKVLEVFKVVKY